MRVQEMTLHTLTLIEPPDVQAMIRVQEARLDRQAAGHPSSKVGRRHTASLLLKARQNHLFAHEKQRRLVGSMCFWTSSTSGVIMTPELAVRHRHHALIVGSIAFPEYSTWLPLIVAV